MKHGIYKVTDPHTATIMYVGSTTLSLDQLEYNHRHAREKEYSMTKFRLALESIGHDWIFEWAEKPRDIKREHAEIIEGALIRNLGPFYNESRYPYERSVHEGRFADVFGDVIKEET